MLEINDKINRFVDDLFTFERDIELTAVPIVPYQNNKMKMAAEGSLEPVNTKIKIGWLTDSSNDVFARVFYNQRREEYEIFFLPEKNQTLKNCVMGISNSNVFFTIDESEKAVIPKSMNINPVEEELFISIPEGHVTFNKKNLDGEHEIICRNNCRLKFSTKYNKSDNSLIFTFYNESNFSDKFSKLLIIYQSAENEMGLKNILIPVMDFSAKITSYCNLPDKFTIAVFL